MKRHVRLLLVEDMQSDADIVLRELERVGYEPEWSRVETESDFVGALDQEWEIVLADYSLPRFSGLRALEILRQRESDLPFILMSGAIGEDAAVSAMKGGANDFIPKDKLARLGGAVGRELRNALDRRMQRDAEEKVRAGDAVVRLQAAALNAAADAVVITDSDGVIVWVNAAFTTLTGFGADEATGKNPRALLRSGVHDTAFYEHLWTTILSGKVWFGEMTNRRKDGSHYAEAQSITPLIDAGGTITHFIAIKRDLTERNRLQAQLLQSQKLETVGQLAGAVAHDFNNVLTVINSTAELAALSLPEGSQARADCGTIRDAGDHAAALTRQLLAFSRKQILAPVVTDLNRVAVNIAPMLRRLLPANVAVKMKPAEMPWPVRVDPTQMDQVLMNLAVNGRDAMPNGGTLTVETANVELDREFAAAHAGMRPGPYAMIAVADTGVGMDARTQQRIFEPFFTTKAPGKGTGLGLATVHGIVAQSGGTVTVYSEVNRGTVFKIYFPKADEAAALSADGQATNCAHGTETILVADDDESIRNVAARILTELGYTVLLASNAADALQYVRAHPAPIHLLLTDMVMPGLNGRDLALSWRSMRPDTKVLLTSGYASDSILSGRELGAAEHFIRKPYSMADLSQAVRKALEA